MRTGSLSENLKGRDETMDLKELVHEGVDSIKSASEQGSVTGF
jgi:hypothetical protein